MSLTSRLRQKEKLKNSPSLGPYLFWGESVSVEFLPIRALNNVSFKIFPGEVIFLTGPSGAGKTTFLRLLAGDLRPHSGNLKSLAKGVVAPIFQDLKLDENLSAKENLILTYDSQIHGKFKSFKEEMDEYFEFFGLTSQTGKKIKKLNRGAKQKVAIMRAVLCHPEVIVADEPSSSLDAENARRVFDLFNLMNSKWGTTIIWASHNKELVRKFGGRILHLDRGHLIHSGHTCFI